MVIIHLTKHFHSGFVKSMAVIPGNSEQSAKNVITILLNSFDHRCHCRAIQPELDCILSQAKVVEWEEVRVSLDDVGAVLLQDQPGGGEGGRDRFSEGTPMSPCEPGWCSSRSGIHVCFAAQLVYYDWSANL